MEMATSAHKAQRSKKLPAFMQLYSIGFPGLQLEGDKNILKPARLLLPAEPRSAWACAACHCCRGPACRSPHLPSWRLRRFLLKPWNVHRTHRRWPAVSQQSLAKTSEKTKLSITYNRLLHLYKGTLWHPIRSGERSKPQWGFFLQELIFFSFWTKPLFSYGEPGLLSCH